MNDPFWLVKQDSATVADREQLLADLLVAQVVEHLPTEPDEASGFEERSSTAPGVALRRLGCRSWWNPCSGHRKKARRTPGQPMHSSARLDRLGRRMMEGTYTRVALNGTVLLSQRKECCMRFRTRMVLLLPLLESRSRTIRD